MSVKVALYGKLGELIGRELELPDPLIGRTIRDVRQYLAQKHPRAAMDLLSNKVRACVDDALVDDGHIVAATQEIAFLPPVSGG